MATGIDRLRLYYIWDLTNTDKNGKVGISEFIHAMWFINKLQLQNLKLPGTSDLLHFADLGQGIR
jgi:hypothetical protein